jgi:hypothetical protein
VKTNKGDEGKLLWLLDSDVTTDIFTHKSDSEDEEDTISNTQRIKVEVKAIKRIVELDKDGSPCKIQSRIDDVKAQITSEKNGEEVKSSETHHLSQLKGKTITLSKKNKSMATCLWQGK